jgi:D-arabinose 1-dehydrogenase-like Zn-dependent alcohol dehydrogenase
MKAAVLREFKKPLTIEEVDRPKPGAGEVLIKMEACGVCHSDLHVADGDWSQLAGIVKKPLILGHEIAGRVIEKGPGVRDFEVGDRVGVPWIHWTCGECQFCLEGNENLCTGQKITGVTVDGGYAEFVKAPASHALKIPEGLSSVEAAPLFCAGVTVYRALKHARVSPGQRLAVFGVGGLGISQFRSGRVSARTSRPSIFRMRNSRSQSRSVRLPCSMLLPRTWLRNCVAKAASISRLSLPQQEQRMTRRFIVCAQPELSWLWVCQRRTSASRRS